MYSPFAGLKSPFAGPIVNAHLTNLRSFSQDRVTCLSIGRSQWKLILNLGERKACHGPVVIKNYRTRSFRTHPQFWKQTPFVLPVFVLRGWADYRHDCHWTYFYNHMIVLLCNLSCRSIRIQNSNNKLRNTELFKGHVIFKPSIFKGYIRDIFPGCVPWTLNFLLLFVSFLAK